MNCPDAKIIRAQNRRSGATKGSGGRGCLRFVTYLEAAPPKGPNLMALIREAGIKNWNGVYQKVRSGMTADEAIKWAKMRMDLRSKKKNGRQNLR